MNPSALILVKNEAYYLPYVLTQTEGFFDSFVLYDVGSTDGTREVIKWWVDHMKGKADIFVRYLPHAPPETQGAFRNSQILEGNREFYWILDGDELYTKEDLGKISAATSELQKQHRYDPRKKYGVIRRVEVNDDLTQQYVERRGHHRLYSSDAYWVGTHPGEVAAYRQQDKSEIQFPDITCWHMHNTLRSPKEKEALKRLARKPQRTYHPGETMIDLNLLDELPALREPIEDFEVSPALAALQEKYANGTQKSWWKFKERP